jgi:hypothetical protein
MVRYTYSIQHYVIKFVSDMWQVSDFLRVVRFPPPIESASPKSLGVRHICKAFAQLCLCNDQFGCNNAVGKDYCSNFHHPTLLQPGS